jgi:hypothetical protein
MGQSAREELDFMTLIGEAEEGAADQHSRLNIFTLKMSTAVFVEALNTRHR